MALRDYLWNPLNGFWTKARDAVVNLILLLALGLIWSAILVLVIFGVQKRVRRKQSEHEYWQKDNDNGHAKRS